MCLFNFCCRRLSDIASQVFMMKEDVRSTSGSLSGSSPVTSSVWVPPLPGSFKINVDAAFYSTTKEACLSLVVRDHQGLPHLCAATRVNNVDSALHAEFKAILFGLTKASKFQFLSVLLESDSLIAIKEIKKQISFCEWEGIISDVIDMSSKFQSCSFYHVRRVANICAHNLAKLAYELGVCKVWRVFMAPKFL